MMSCFGLCGCLSMCINRSNLPGSLGKSLSDQRLSPVAVAIDLSLGKLLRCPERPSSAKSGQFEVHRKERKLMPSLTKFIWISVAFISAITLAFLSVHVERVGPELAVYGNMCGPSGYDFCYKPVLKGAFRSLTYSTRQAFLESECLRSAKTSCPWALWFSTLPSISQLLCSSC